MDRQAARADALLLIAALLWGFAFVPQRTAMQHMGPFTFNGLRFALGGLAFAPLLRIWPRPRLERLGRHRLHLAASAMAGLVLFAAATLQQAGLVHTSAGKAAFITGLYVPLVSVLGLFVGERTQTQTWLGIVLAGIGLYWLCVPESTQINRGDVLLLAGAVLWAVHVLVIGKLSPRVDPLRLAVVQCAVVAVASLGTATGCEPIAKADLRAGLGAILYGGLASVAIAYTLQILAQRHAPPAHAALLFSLEAVFAALAGWGLLGESLNQRELIGAGLMLGGALLSQFGRFRLLSGRTRTLAAAAPPRRSR